MPHIYNVVRYVPLHSKVLIVAVIGGSGMDWSAYICNVAGESHSKETQYAATHGAKVDKEVAYHYFPELIDKYVWRR